MSTARSRKNKGLRFENYLVDRLSSLDNKTSKTFASGVGLEKGDIYIPRLGIIVEAKNATQVNLVKDFQQCERQVFGGNIGVLMIRNPKEPEFKQTFVVMDLEDWIERIGGKQELGGINQSDKWVVKKAIDVLKQLLKLLEKYN